MKNYISMENGAKKRGVYTFEAFGFTLIELLVVIAIIGLLASVVLVALNASRAKARDAKRLADKKQIVTAIHLYYADNNSWPPTTAADWTCFAPTGETCWNGAYGGSNLLVTAMQPYIALLPNNGADAGTYGYNRVLYHRNYSSALGTGAYIYWIQENAISTSICPWVIVQYDKYYYCREFVGP